MSGRIGVVGGGQLALMLAEAARPLGVELHVQTPQAGDPATRLATSTVLAPLDDPEGTRSLAARTDAISFENEWLDLDLLASLEADGVAFVPRLEALRPLVSKRQQRELLIRLNLPSPRWIPLDEVLISPEPQEAILAAAPRSAQVQPSASLSASVTPTAAPPPPRLPEGFDFPLMAKAATGGYDGRGTQPITNSEKLTALLQRVDSADWLLEEFVAFDQELAIVACRDRSGTVACFPVVETHQHQRICDWVLAPAAISQAVQARARNVAASLLTALDYVGVLSIEFFFGPAGLQINELAPRTHNSGHYTIEAARTSQFAQQVRIVCGQPLGPTDLKLPAALMVNLLGYESSSRAYKSERKALSALPGASLHWYGKLGSTPGRKLGHITLALKETDPARRATEAARRLKEVRALWPLPPEKA